MVAPVISVRRRRNCALRCNWRPATPMRKTRWRSSSKHIRSSRSSLKWFASWREGFLKGNSHTFRLDGKLAVVTGAASGIGRAVAQRFAASGACVRLLDIDEKAADAVASEIRATGGNAKAYGCDVSQPRAVNARSEEHTSELQSQFHLVCRL